MTKILFLVTFLSFSINAKLVEYSEAVDVFEIGESLVQGKGQVFNHFIKKYPLNLEDKSKLELYRKVRQKLSPPETKFNGINIFEQKTRRLNRFSYAFLSSKSVGQALMKLKKGGLVEKDITHVTNFYKHFKTKIASMVRESLAFKGKLKTINKKISKEKVEATLKKIRKFFKLPKGKKHKMKAFLVWGPKEREVEFDSLGHFLIIRINPLGGVENLDSIDFSWGFVRSMISEFTHTQKENWSKLFNKTCNIFSANNKLKNHEKFVGPLTLALSEMYLSEVQNKKKFVKSKVWSKNPWINQYSKSLHTVFKESLAARKTVHDGFINNAAIACQSLVEFGEFLN